MDRLEVINHFVEKYNYETYCEIGVFTGYTLDGCKAKIKLGVDPICGHYHGKETVECVSSDEFFAGLPEDKKYDIFFIDGYHEAKQVLRDIKNALKHINDNGVIILHDMNPPTYQYTTVGVDGCWTGDCYKAFLELAVRNFSNINDLYVISTDWGIGILKPGGYQDEGALKENNDKVLEEVKQWEVFDKNRKVLLNLISVEEFLEREK